MKGYNYKAVLIIMITIALMGQLLLTDGIAASEKFPSRQIDFVIGYSPGATDISLRPFVEKLQEVLRQPIVFVYKPGAGGSIGASFVTRAKPDGYTLFGCSGSPLISTPLTSKEGIGYTLDDFTPLVRLTTQPSLVVVKSDSQIRTIKDLVAEAKKAPGKLNYSTAGIYGTDHLPTEVFQKVAGFRVTHIPSTGVAPAMTAVLGGHVTFGVGPVQPVLPHLKSGALRLLAVIGKERIPEFPDAPTLIESGYPVNTFGWYGIVGPKNMDKQTLQILLDACDKTMQTYGKNIEEQEKKLGATPSYLKGDAFGKELKSLWDATKQVVEDLKKTQ